jgi:two-component system, LytTR family, response regulator
MKITCIIVDDEPLAIDRAQGFVMKLPYLDLIATFENAFDALVFLKTNPIDLIFLDINMDGFSGIQFLETNTINSEVIFTTAYDAFALKGFDLKVTDYLLKPYTFERFVQAVEQVENKMNKEKSTSEKKFIFIKTAYKLEKINLNEILYIEGMSDYRKIVTPTKKIMTLQTFSDLEKEIPRNIICRVHKSYMVSLDKIESIEKDRIKIKDAIIPISETYKKDFFALISHCVGGKAKKIAKN